jgi:hypothetical protein
MGWVISATPRPLCPLERPGTHCVEGWVDPRAGVDGCGKIDSFPLGYLLYNLTILLKNDIRFLCITLCVHSFLPRIHYTVLLSEDGQVFRNMLLIH